LHLGRIAAAIPLHSADGIRPFNPPENGPRKPLKMLQDQREILLSGGFP
jgi:hypothetical protein